MNIHWLQIGSLVAGVGVFTYVVIRAIGKNKTDLKRVEQELAHQKEVWPMKVQAYERLILLMERISLEQLAFRVDPSWLDLPVLSFQGLLLQEIRQEFTHNLVQQMYVSEEVWEKVVQARDQVIAQINFASGTVGEGAVGRDLLRAVFMQVEEGNLTKVAIAALRKEIQRSWGDK
ncbi:MAG: hypothetical protein ACK4R6_00895 [Spirosomataceae bacterium]